MLSSLKLHDRKVLWPQRMSEQQVLDLRDTTLDHVWQTTYQGNATSPGGNIFQRSWFENRFSHGSGKPIARWLSADTALSDAETAALSAILVGDLMPDYTLRIVDMWSDWVQFPQLVSTSLKMLRKYDSPKDILRGIIIEKKASGFSLIQTLRQQKDVSQFVLEFTPKESKELRWTEASSWTFNEMVLLPEPSEKVSWLLAFEEDLFNAPGILHSDRLDAFAQLILFLSNLLSAGLAAKGVKK